MTSRKTPHDMDVGQDLAVLVSREFRRLQRDPSLVKMSIFDLIDHCTEKFENMLSAKDNLAGFVQAYLIFNYFINNFIMMHFNGFQDFLDSAHHDFVLYLNLYNFFKFEADASKAVVLPKNGIVFAYSGSHVHSSRVIDVILAYLRDNHLLSFDIGVLHHWLDEYIEYYRDREAEPESPEIPTSRLERRSPHPPYSRPSPDKTMPTENADKTMPSGPDKTMSTFSARFEDLDFSDDDLFEFNSKFPDISHAPSSVPYPVDSKTPYPRDNPESMPHSRDYSARPPIPVPILHTSERGRATSRPSEYPHTPAPSFQLAQSHPNLQANPSHQSQRIQVPQMQSSQIPPPPHLVQRDSHIQRSHIQRDHLRNHQLPQLPPSHSQFQNPPPSHSHFHPPPNRPANPALRDYAICGLKNLGSSCYINSTLQVLAGIASFGKLLSSANKARRIAANSSTDAMYGLISTFNANGGANVAPTKFLRILAAAKPDFNIPYEQQDAQEFLLFLLDKMHAELASKPSSEEEFVDYSKKWRINVNQKEKNDYYKWYTGLLQHEGESIINDIFQGHIQSKLLCNTCGHHSISYSSFNILSLPIPGGNDQHVDLTDCLKYYTQDEVLSGENAWRCPKCNKEKTDEQNPMDVVFQPKRGLFKFSKRSKSPAKKAAAPLPPSTKISIKQLSFIKLPPVLFIHLSRFSMLNVTDKLNTDIIYPLRLKFNHSSHDIYYSLTGLINHFGTLKSGHYTSLVNKRKVHKGEDALLNPFWCYFDDDNVRSNVVHGDIASMNGSSLHSRDVYVLCYERI